MTTKTAREDSQEIKAQLTQQLLPRAFKYKQLQDKKLIPETTETRVVVECLKKTVGFKINQYKLYQKILNGVMGASKFNSFVRRCNQVIENQMMIKQSKENEPFFSKIQLLLKISILIASLAFILLAILVYMNTSSFTIQATIMLYVSEVLICSTGIIAGLCPIFLYRAEYKPLNHQIIIEEKLHQLAYEENKLNEHLNCKWTVGKNFFWLELNIDRALIVDRDFIEQGEQNQKEESVASNAGQF